MPAAAIPVSQEARAVHEAATIIDLHADTAKFMARGYDLGRAHRVPWPLSRYGGHVDLPRLREGGFSAQFFGMWTFPLPERGCEAEVHRQLDALARAAAAGGLMLCQSAADIRAARARGLIGALAGIEGGQALARGPRGAGQEARAGAAIESLRRFAERGVRYLGLLHFSRNALGFPEMGLGADAQGGLSALGCEVVDACHRLGVLVDLAHINRKGFFEVVARTAAKAPLLLTHTGAAGVHPHWRNADDEQLRAVARSGGVIGVIFAPRFLGQDGVKGVVAHLLHLVRVAGEDAVALGSDWDGFVRPSRGLASPAELPHLTEALLRSSVPVRIIHKLLGGNVLRVLEGRYTHSG